MRVFDGVTNSPAVDAIPVVNIDGREVGAVFGNMSVFAAAEALIDVGVSVHRITHLVDDDGLG